MRLRFRQIYNVHINLHKPQPHMRTSSGEGSEAKTGTKMSDRYLVSPLFQVQARSRHMHYPETQLPRPQQQKSKRKLDHQDLLEREASSWLGHEGKNSNT